MAVSEQRAREPSHSRAPGECVQMRLAESGLVPSGGQDDLQIQQSRQRISSDGGVALGGGARGADHSRNGTWRSGGHGGSGCYSSPKCTK